MQPWIAGLCLAVPLWAWAAPYVPVDDATVLERLPVAGTERRELRRLRTELTADPGNRLLALDLARRYIALGRADADPRYYGYAEAVLAPWLAAVEPWPEALVLRATILQNRHAFGSALADLDAALRRAPRLPQAWLTRAAILEVQGDYPGALRSCLPLVGLGSPLAATVCLASAASYGERAAAAYTRLRTALDTTDGDADERLWARTVLAELAERLGRVDEAEAQYRAALASGRHSPYLLAGYADFLLDRRRPAEVVTLLAAETRADPLLLRLALAEQALNRPEFAVHAAELRARFAAGRQRGDTRHQGEEARYALYIDRNPAEALRLALANWTAQREPRDARGVLEAARAAGQPDAARQVLDFLQRTGLRDARLAPLLLTAATGGVP